MGTAAFIFHTDSEMPHMAEWPEAELLKKYTLVQGGGPEQLETPEDVANLLAYALSHYRGRYKRIRKPTRGGTTAYLMSKGGPREFEFRDPRNVKSHDPWARDGQERTLSERRAVFNDTPVDGGEVAPPRLWNPRDDLDACVDAIEFMGGELLALWTSGDRLHFAYVKAPEPLEGFELHQNQTKLTAPDEAFIKNLRRKLEDSPFAPDWAQVEDAFGECEVQLPAFFDAFGLPGVPGAVSKKMLWNHYLSVARAHLTGEETDSSALKSVNKVLRDADEETLKKKPARQPEQCALDLFMALQAMEEEIGETNHPDLKHRWDQARRWQDLIDDGAVPELVEEDPDNALHVSFSAVQVLRLFPLELRNDALFLMLLGGELEDANAHGLSGQLRSLASGVGETGATLVVFPVSEHDSFCSTFGIKANRFAARDGFEVALMLDLPGKARKSAEDAARNWLADKPGCVARFHDDASRSQPPEALPWGTKPDANDLAEAYGAARLRIPV